MGTFGLSPEQVKEAVCKAWPCVVDTIRREAERPLNERYTSLQRYQLSESGWLQELKDEYTDLHARHKELEVLCKVRAQILRAKERECTNWAIKAHALGCCHHRKIKRPRSPSGYHLVSTPLRTMVRCITELSTHDPTAELSAIASPLSSAPDNVVSWASVPLTSEELYIPDRDIPRETPLENRGLLAPLEMEEITMQGAPGSLTSRSPHSPRW
jgi:hypothetical protein